MKNISLLLLSILITFSGCASPVEYAVDEEPAVNVVNTVDDTFRPSKVTVSETDQPEIQCYERDLYWELFYPHDLKWPDEINDHIAETFLQSLLINDCEAIAYIVDATDTDAYKFLEDIEFSSGEIIDSMILSRTYAEEEYELGKTYTMKLIVEKSASPLFPAGESLWELDVTAQDDYLGIIPRFERIEPAKANATTIALLIHDSKARSELINLCSSFATYISYFGDTDHMNSIVPKWGDSNGCYRCFYHGLLDMGIMGMGLREDNSADEFKRVAEKYLGITNLDLSNFCLYDEEENTVICPGHGGLWVMLDLEITDYCEFTNEYSVLINYYVDSCRLVVAWTSQYKLKQNADGTFTMQSIRLLYYSGFPARGGQV